MHISWLYAMKEFLFDLISDVMPGVAFTMIPGHFYQDIENAILDRKEPSFSLFFA